MKRLCSGNSSFHSRLQTTHPNSHGKARSVCCPGLKRPSGRSRLVTRAMFDEMEAFTNLLSPGVASVLTAVIAVSSVSINLYGGLLTERKRADLAKQVERERQAAVQVKEMRSIVARYRGPLLEAAVDLESRLVAVATGRTARGGGRGVVEEEVVYTLFTIAQFLGFVELVRREGPRERSFLQQGNPQGTDTLANLLEGFRFIMCAHPSALQAWYDEGDNRDHPGARSRPGVPYADIAKSLQPTGTGSAAGGADGEWWLALVSLFKGVPSVSSGAPVTSSSSSSSSSSSTTITPDSGDSSSNNSAQASSSTSNGFNGNGVSSSNGNGYDNGNGHGNGNGNGYVDVGQSGTISSGSSSYGNGSSSDRQRSGAGASTSGAGETGGGGGDGGAPGSCWPGGNTLHMSRGTQRAVGSFMIITPVGASRHYTTSYSDFYRRFYTDESFAAWLQPIFQDLMSLIGTPGGWPGCSPFPVNPWTRLLLLQQLLVDTIDLLDPFMVRTSGEHRWRLAPVRYASLPNAESYKERLRALESLVDTAMPSMNSVFLRVGWARSARDGNSNEYLGSNANINEKLYYLYPGASGGGGGTAGSSGGAASSAAAVGNDAGGRGGAAVAARIAYERGLSGLPYSSVDEGDGGLDMPYFSGNGGVTTQPGWRPAAAPAASAVGGSSGWGSGAGRQPQLQPLPQSLPGAGPPTAGSWASAPGSVPYIPPPNALRDPSELRTGTTRPPPPPPLQQQQQPAWGQGGQERGPNG